MSVRKRPSWFLTAFTLTVVFGFFAAYRAGFLAAAQVNLPVHDLFVALVRRDDDGLHGDHIVRQPGLGPLDQTGADVHVLAAARRGRHDAVTAGDHRAGDRGPLRNPA